MNKKIYIVSHQIDYEPSILLAVFDTLEQAEKFATSKNDWDYDVCIEIVELNKVIDDNTRNDYNIDYKLYNIEGKLINQVIDGKESFYTYED